MRKGYTARVLLGLTVMILFVCISLNASGQTTAIAETQMPTTALAIANAPPAAIPAVATSENYLALAEEQGQANITSTSGTIIGNAGGTQAASVDNNTAATAPVHDPYDPGPQRRCNTATTAPIHDPYGPSPQRPCLTASTTKATTVPPADILNQQSFMTTTAPQPAPNQRI